ncbi:MAG: DedA family protein [Patescibacteria group bacterium]|nr:DedA family protein [Patescibacteria group bacterium]
MISFIVNFVATLADRFGAFGVGIGMALESLGIPFSSMVIDIASVPLVHQGRATYLGLILIATIGGTIGSIVAYYIGYFLGDIIRYFRKGKLVKQEEKLNEFIEKYGDYSIFFAQLFGATRSFISIPAGMVKFKLSHFILGTFFGTLIISSIMILFSPIMYKFWTELSVFLGLPVWISIILCMIFILELTHLYRVTIKSIRANNGDNGDLPSKE